MRVRGYEVPSLLYGTAWKEERTRALTALALATGFVGIDTANQRKHYFEAAVGEGIADAGIARERLFLQTKFTYARGQDHRRPYDLAASPEMQVRQSFASSLQHLGTTFVDSYVLHGPWSGTGLLDIDYEVWRTFVGLQKEGGTRLLGISNVSIEQLELLCATVGEPPAFVQNRCYARHGWDRDVRAFCRAHDIVYQGFSLLTANWSELNRPAIHALMKRTQKTIAQLVFAFAASVGMLPLTGTSDEQHMREDLAFGSVELTPADVATIETIGETIAAR